MKIIFQIFMTLFLHYIVFFIKSFNIDTEVLKEVTPRMFSLSNMYLSIFMIILCLIIGLFLRFKNNFSGWWKQNQLIPLCLLAIGFIGVLSVMFLLKTIQWGNIFLAFLALLTFSSLHIDWENYFTRQ